MASSGITHSVGGLNTALACLAGAGTPTVASNPTVVMTAGVNVIPTVASSGDGVLLPAGIPQFGVITLFNTAAANTCDVFPNLGGTINGGTASTGQVGVAVKTGCRFVQVGTDGLTWVSDNAVTAIS